MKKKIFSLILAVSMILTLAITANAENFTEGYYTYSVSNNEATITDVDTDISGDIVIPDTLGGYPVTEIGVYAFEFCRGLTSVIIPDSVVLINRESFSGCGELSSVIIGNSVTTIGVEAFSVDKIISNEE